MEKIQPELADSYKGISLASSILKTFERMVRRRLETSLEKYKELPMHQLSFSNKKIVIALLIDMGNAYDNVNLKIFGQQMTEIGIPKFFRTK